MHQNSRDIERLLRLFVEQTKEHAVMLLDPEARIIWWSRGAEHIFGMKGSEAIGQNVAVLFTPEDLARGLPEHEIAVARADGAAEDDRWQLRADGIRFWATGVTISLRDESRNLLGFGKILFNRTEVKEQVDVLRNRLAAAEAESHRKDVFLSTLSHELRNPLAPLSNAAQLIRMRVPLTPELEYLLKMIERQVGNLRQLVDDLMDLSRINSGKVEFKKEFVSLQEVIRRAVEDTSMAVQQRRHSMEVLLPSAPIFIEADPARLEQVFVNLINNAVKYTLEEGRIWVSATIEGEEAVAYVVDNGIGIPPEVLPHIFKLFTQVESSHQLSQGGLGIGLTVVKNLVALHGGSVQVNSAGLGKGSKFIVRLPLSARAGHGDAV